MNQPVSQEKARNRRRRISYGVAVVLTAIIAAAVYQQSRVLPRRLSDYVNSHYLAGTNFEFSVDGISGFLPRRIELKNPVLRYHSENASYNVFRADEIAVSYDLMPVFAFRLSVGDLALRNVSIHLRQAEDGRLVLPYPERRPDEKRLLKASPVVEVRRFSIDGLEMKFGGNKTQLAVRDVNMTGWFGYADGVGRLGVDEGRAYLIDSKKTVSSIRLAARSDGASLFIEDFAVRLDESFVIARGEFRDGRLRDVDLVFNPVSLPELHELGLIGDETGRFSGRAALSGPVDSLRVKGEVSGEGLGVELSQVHFDGVFTPDALDLDRLNGAVFGSQVDGAFRIEIESEDFVFDGTCTDLDLGRGFITDSDLPPMSLTGRVGVECTKAVERYAWRGDLSRAVVDGFEAFNVSGEGVYEEASGMVIRRLSLERPGFRAEGKGTADTSDVLDMVFKVEATDLSYFWNHFDLPQIGGASVLNGHLAGPIDDFQVNLSGEFRDLVFENMGVEAGSVQAEVRRVGTLAPEVSAALNGTRGTISGVRFDAPVVNLEIDTSVVQVRNARFARGDTTIVVDLDVIARGERARIDVRHATAATPSDTWHTARPTSLRVAPGVMEIDSLVMVCPRGEIGATGVVRERERTLDLDVWGRGINLAVLRDVGRLPFDVRGTGDFSLLLYGSSEDPRARLVADVREGVVDSVAFDALSLDAAFDGSSYTLNRMLVVTGRDSVRARGTWGCDVSPWRIARKERPESLWGAPLAADLRFHHFPLSTVFDAMHRPSVVAAAYDGTLVIGGTLESPAARARGAIVPAMGEGKELPPTRIEVSYGDGLLRVTDIAMTDVIDLKLSGMFPLYLSARHGARIESDEPLEFRLDIAPLDGRPAELGRYLRGVSLLRGAVSGTVVGSGTPAAPRLSGGISLSRGDLRVIGLQEAFTDLVVRVDFIDDVVRLTSLSARSGEDGTLTGTGWARVSNYRPVDYKADLAMREFWLRSIPDVETRQDGTVSVRLAEWRDGRRIPHITGSLDVREAIIRLDLAETTEGTQSEFTRPTDRPDWVCQLDLRADKNAWLRNPESNIEMEGDLILYRDEQGLYFRGDMSILRGSYQLYGNKFQITDGTLDFSASETLRPSIAIDAYTPHRTDESGEKNIYLTLTWPYDQKEPRISLRYDEPGYSESDIWRMLGSNNLAAGMATGALERLLNEQMTGGLTVDVEQRPVGDGKSGTALESETSIGVGKYLWEDVYLQYRRGLSVESEQEVNVEYRLGRRLLLRSQIIYNSRRNRAGIAGQNTDEYNLDLKYRWEF
jgi:hypothetical protein